MAVTLTRNDKVAWDASPDAASYRVEFYDATNVLLANEPTVGPEITALALLGSLDGLSSCKISVYAVDAEGRESTPLSLLGVALDMAPAPPTNIRVEPIV
jgi:hypothetical protein